MAAESQKIGRESRIRSNDVYKALGFQPLQEAYKWMSIIKPRPLRYIEYIRNNYKKS